VLVSGVGWLGIKAHCTMGSVNVHVWNGASEKEQNVHYGHEKSHPESFHHPHIHHDH